MPTTRAARSLIDSVSPTVNDRLEPSGLVKARSPAAARLSTITPSDLRRSSSEPESMRVGPPSSVASSTPMMVHISCVPSARRTSRLLRYIGTADSTPSMARTRSSEVSRIGLGSSVKRTCGSITQTSACGVSWMKLHMRLV